MCGIGAENEELNQIWFVSFAFFHVQSVVPSNLSPSPKLEEPFQAYHLVHIFCHGVNYVLVDPTACRPCSEGQIP